MARAMLVVTGSMTQDAELSFTKNGKAVTKWTMPIEDGFGDNKNTQWATFVLWGQRGEQLHAMLLKGVHVMITARRVMSKAYTNREGKAASTLEIWVDQIELLSSVKNASNSSNNVEQEQTPPYNDEEVDDIPF